MQVTFDAKRLGEGVWEARLRPADVLRLPGSPARNGSRSILTADAVEFDNGRIHANIDQLRALVVGGSEQAIVVLSRSAHPSGQGERDDGAPSSQSSGDQEFLEEISSLPKAIASAAQNLLSRIRQKEPGWMKRGGRRNFSNQPDNFWYAVVQPRSENISITVRGRPEQFGPTSFNLKNDRPGYTRFYLSHPSEVDEAFRIISASRRRKS